jgi:hypothetical protein
MSNCKTHRPGLEQELQWLLLHREAHHQDASPISTANSALLLLMSQVSINSSTMMFSQAVQWEVLEGQLEVWTTEAWELLEARLEVWATEA